MIFTKADEDAILAASDAKRPIVTVWIDAATGQLKVVANIPDRIYVKGMLEEASFAISNIKQSVIAQPTNGDIDRLG